MATTTPSAAALARPALGEDLARKVESLREEAAVLERCLLEKRRAVLMLLADIDKSANDAVKPLKKELRIDYVWCATSAHRSFDDDDVAADFPVDAKDLRSQLVNCLAKLRKDTAASLVSAKGSGSSCEKQTQTKDEELWKTTDPIKVLLYDAF
jgi:hypothetical protein